MREMWYGPHLKELFGLIYSDEDREALINLSIEERVLTELTAFLALEPEQGGEPCIGCLFNDGNIVISTHELALDDVEVKVTPNPARDVAKVFLSHPEQLLAASNWTARVFDSTGKELLVLDPPLQDGSTIQWTWNIDDTVQAGFYFCSLESQYGQVMTKM